MSCLSARERDRFVAVLEDNREETSKGGSTAFGGMVYENPDAIRQAIHGLIPFTNRR